MTKKSSLKETPNLLITIIVAILLGGCGLAENILATQTSTYPPIPSVTGTIAGIKDSPTPPNTSTTSSEFIGERYDSIHKAAEYGDVEAVKWYLENGVSINSKDSEYGGSPLHWAASFGRTEVVKLLIQEGADLTLKDSNGATPLHIAADSGQLQVCSILVGENENTLYEVDNNGAMPIHMAAVSGHMPIIQYFLEQGMDINARDKGNGQGTPLHWAASNGQTSTISQLLQNGADPTIIDNYGDTAQDVAAKQNHEMAVDILANWTGAATPVMTQTSTIKLTPTSEPAGPTQTSVSSPETASPLDIIEATYISPFGIEETYDEIKYVLGSGIWLARNEEEGVRYWGIKVFAEGEIEFEITINEKDRVEVNLKGPRSICEEIDATLQENDE